MEIEKLSKDQATDSQVVVSEVEKDKVHNS